MELFSVPDIRVDIRDYTEKDLHKSYGIKDQNIKSLYDSGDIDRFFEMINSVYHTRLAVSQFKGHFSKAWLEHNGVSEFIKKCSNIIGKKPYSFSTKVYSFVDPNKYPIIDRNVSSLLREYMSDNGKRFSFGKYNEYISVYDSFKEKYGLHARSYKQIDVFLWTYAVALQNYWKKQGVIQFKSVEYKG